MRGDDQTGRPEAGAGPDGAPGLIGALEAEVARERDTILAQAEEAAAGILAQARRRARKRFGLAAAALRRERAATLGRARARAAHARHRAFLAENARIAEDGLGRIAAELAALWADPEARAAWCRDAVALACARLGAAEGFRAEHPPELPEDARAAIRAAFAAGGCPEPELAPHPELDAGLRLIAPHATVDATIAGLMRERERIAGAYLAELGRGAEATGEGGTGHG